jgi:hypothetical protein
MSYVPGGIHTVPPEPAALIAALNALVASFTPVGSAPSLVTDTEPEGWVSGALTCSKSAKSIVYEDAVSSESTCSLKVVPAGYDVGNRRCAGARARGPGRPPAQRPDQG